jgi:uncharacterized protein DUF4203
MHGSVSLIGALAGVVLLFFGRSLFWLCVAAVGFAAGVELAPHLLHEPTPLLQLSIALVLGFLGALLALLLQKLAVGIVGFAAGGRLAVGLAATFFVQLTNYYWLTFLVGGVLGAILLIALFDPALIFISSLIGAHLITDAIVLPSSGAAILLVGLTILGVIVQAGLYRRRRQLEAVR